MAEDTQGGDAASIKSPTNKPKHELPQTQVGKLWEAFGNPDERINVHPGASYNPTHTPKPKDISISESLKTIKLEDFSTFHKKPCARDSLLLGLGAGFGIGGIRGIVGGMSAMWPASNWAVGAFAIASLASYEFCQRRRVNEMKGMQKAVELMAELKAKKQKEKEQLQAIREAEAEELRKRKSWTNLSNYKFW
ncbi:hypothetical protein ZTR_04180 [Talaromyces verruculosus]|nr:hypothetical protein ZTR_04180 [Talaromyces verruculosus]